MAVYFVVGHSLLLFLLECVKSLQTARVSGAASKAVLGTLLTWVSRTYLYGFRRLRVLELCLDCFEFGLTVIIGTYYWYMYLLDLNSLPLYGKKRFDSPLQSEQATLKETDIEASAGAINHETRTNA